MSDEELFDFMRKNLRKYAFAHEMGHPTPGDLVAVIAALRYLLQKGDLEGRLEVIKFLARFPHLQGFLQDLLQPGHMLEITFLRNQADQLLSV